MGYDREVPMGKGLSVCSMTQALGTPSLGVKCLKADRELEQFGVTRVSDERGQKNGILPISELIFFVQTLHLYCPCTAPSLAHK